MEEGYLAKIMKEMDQKKLKLVRYFLIFPFFRHFISEERTLQQKYKYSFMTDLDDWCLYIH